MFEPREKQSQAFRDTAQGLGAMQRDGQRFVAPIGQTEGSRAVEAWFLGPKGENGDMLERFVVDAIRDQVHWRRNFHPDDPVQISERVRRDPRYLEATDLFQDAYQDLIAALKKSIPWFSMRYQGHMTADPCMPAVVGYIAALLYNPNNVAFAGSPATTELERHVGDDLCKMLGYKAVSRADRPNIEPWGHLACGGTVANTEAMWSARNLKFYPIALKQALTSDQRLEAGRFIDIEAIDGGPSRRLIDLDLWALLNLRVDAALDLPDRLKSEHGIDQDTLYDAVAPFTIGAMGVLDFARRFLGGLRAGPAVCVPATCHYSFNKAAGLLGVGAGNMIKIPVDEDARQNIDHLEAVLEKRLADRAPVIGVVGVMGSTEETAVDPLQKIVALREKFRERGMEFTIHADAAWGGYHACLLGPHYRGALGTEPPLDDPAPQIGLSNYVETQFRALPDADSITVDPHKSGYAPYPGGALCYRNGAMRFQVLYQAPVLGEQGEDVALGVYGVEGSKPGAAAAATYLAHRVIGTDQNGYGRILGAAMFSCKMLYAHLLTRYGDPDGPIHFVPLPRLPAERKRDPDPAEIEEERRRIRERLVNKPIHEIVANEEDLAFLREIGPDENVLTYAFNFRRADGSLNPDLETANAFNRAIFEPLSPRPDKEVSAYRFMVSSTDLTLDPYGARFMNAYKKRLLQREDAPGDTVMVLRSVVLDPWLAEFHGDGSFLKVIEKELGNAIHEALRKVDPKAPRPFSPPP